MSRSSKERGLLDPSSLLELSRDVLAKELAGVGSLELLIATTDFARALERLRTCEKRIVVSGVGKSGLVARRIAASFRSTGTPSLHLHPLEALHGDLGMIEPGDVALFLSKSGESGELLRLLPILKRIPVPLVSVSCRRDSTLTRQADFGLVVGPLEEAGPLRLVPTTSTTVFQVLGDIFVACLCAARGTTEEDLAFLHPGGVIGTQLSAKVADRMRQGDDMPRVSVETTLREAIVEMIDKKLGMTTVVGPDGRLAGVLTDGDLRRIVHRHGGIDALRTGEVMSRNPRTISGDVALAVAVARMERNQPSPITCLVVVDDTDRPEGVIQLHDCLRAGT